MKHLHMLMALITIGLFLWQSYLVLSKNKRFDKKGKIATHIVYALLIVSGAMAVMPLLAAHVPLQWVVAKIVLLIAAISASIKAFKPAASTAQSKTGILIALCAYIGIVVLAFIKPDNFI